MRREKEAPARGGYPAGAESVPGEERRPEKHPRDAGGAQATRALPFPLRVFRATKPHAHDGRPVRRAPAREREDAQLALAFDGYDPRQRVFRW